MLFLLTSLAIATPSSIDSFPLPEAPSRRFDLQYSEEMDPEAEIWYRRGGYYVENGNRVKHGLEVERKRLRDRERHHRDFIETRRLWENGEEMNQRVESVYQDGVLRERHYVAAPRVQLTIEFNESGQEILEHGRTARGARRKRDRITNHFDEIFEIN